MCPIPQCVYRKGLKASLRATHFHCIRPHCLYAFKNKCELDKHKRSHERREVDVRQRVGAMPIGGVVERRTMTTANPQLCARIVASNVVVVDQPPPPSTAAILPFAVMPAGECPTIGCALTAAHVHCGVPRCHFSTCEPTAARLHKDVVHVLLELPAHLHLYDAAFECARPCARRCVAVARMHAFAVA